ncbi:MAG: ABC transporter permease [Candidatus Cohnella colombiensis]|uniref:ABC transporter permease n=1 Tax=Candidatus Cohnella colombiensis TaxID=3121368 RepID=A0AA95EVG2_9BACL|nr:MAG: ABC transporter permease [Cohnella sp.]
MALFIMIIRKMVQNKWLVASMFFGILMTVALVGTMPIYSEAILSRMLVKDLQTFQEDRNLYPGTHWSSIGFYNESPEKRLKVLSELDDFMANEASPSFGIPVKELVTERRSKSFVFVPAVGVEDQNKSKPSATLRSFTDFNDHIVLEDGRLPSDTPVDGVYEALVTSKALGNFKTVLDTVFEIQDERVQGTILIKPVGIIAKKDDDDPFFRNAALTDLNSAFVVSEKLFNQEVILGNKIPVAFSGWYFVLDYNKMELRNVYDFLGTDEKIRSAVLKRIVIYQTEFVVPALDTISKYFERAKQLGKLMWSLNVPVLIMLGFYMFMVSNLIISRQRNEIAILRSRGAARWQVISSFAIEGLILCGLAFVLGPLLGMMLTKVLGASNGFLEFIQRTSMTVRMNSDAYLFGSIAAGVSFIMMLIPVILATRVTIVGHKQQLARSMKMPFWHKAFLDVLALAISIYGLYTFEKRLKDLQALGLNSDDLNIDPLQFIMPALFIVGSGLLLLRLYPYVLRLIYWIGRKFWPPSLYATLIQVGRSSSQYQFLMIFLIMTIAVGVFSAGAARTLNANTEDRIRYANGADFIIESRWPNDEPPPLPPGSPGGFGGGSAPETASSVTKVIHYLEPSFDPYTSLPGVEHAAKVFVKKNANFSAANDGGTATLIGIDTNDFGNTTWFPEDLLDYHINDYLNLMAPDSRAVLISKTLADQKGLKQGDSINIGWTGIATQPFVVFGIIDYFPTFNPNPAVGSVNTANAKAAASAPMLIVGHLSRIQFQLGLEPYQVWLKMKEGASTAELYDGISNGKFNVTSIVNTKEMLGKAKNDPFLLALNGVLTLGFIISILVSFVGFLLYWILSLKGRTLQNGIMRAIGLSLRQLIGMLALEQLLTSGVAIMIGVLVGNITSILFVPNFQIAFNPSSLVPPFKVIFEAMDFTRLYTIVFIMLLLGLGILSYMLSRIRVHQALKLGED